MKLVSHRGNINGPSEKENHPDYIKSALEETWVDFVEVDVWCSDKNQVVLGHDEPQYDVDDHFLVNSKIICHAKNLPAMEYCLIKNIHCFWHQEDDYTLTSRGYIWVYPDKTPSNMCKSIIVDNKPKVTKYSCYGVCSDYVQLYKACNL